MRIRTDLRRVVALGVIISMGLTGCASSTSYNVIAPDLRDRANQITRIAAVPVAVTVIRASFRDELVDEWSETARINLENALAKHFGSDGHFAVTHFDPREAAEAAQEEVKDARGEMRSLPNPIGKAVTCLSGPALALSEAAGAEALLLVHANSRIGSVGAFVASLTLAVLLLPIAILPPFWPDWIRLLNQPTVALPIAHRSGIMLCLVDSRTGEVIWFDYRDIGGAICLMRRRLNGSLARLTRGSERLLTREWQSPSLEFAKAVFAAGGVGEAGLRPPPIVQVC
jgi:hypothetical protein